MPSDAKCGKDKVVGVQREVQSAKCESAQIKVWVPRVQVEYESVECQVYTAGVKCGLRRVECKV